MICSAVFYLAGCRVAPGFVERRPGVSFSCMRLDNAFAVPVWKPLGLKPGAGTPAKNSRKALQRNFNIPKTDAVANAQCDFHGADPAIVPVEEGAIARTGVVDGDQTVI